MKKYVFILLLISLSFPVKGAAYKSVNVTNAGTINTYFSSTELNSTTDLTISGNIDARDIAFLRDNLKNLSTLNLSTAKINTYTGISGTYGGVTVTYPSNEMPLCSFYNVTTTATNNKLTNITLPATLTSIGGSAFCYCSGLQGTFSIPSSVKSIGDYALYGCTNLTNINVDANNNRYSSNDGILYSKNQDSLFMCPLAKSGIVSIPQNVCFIGTSAFESCTKLTGSLSLPASLKKIDSYGFYNCTGLTGTLQIPESVEVIGDYAFYGCTGIEGTINISKNLKYFGLGAFFLCNNLNSYQADVSNPYYSTSEDILYNKSGDTLLICPGAKTGSFSIPGSVKVIGGYAFYGCNLLTGNLSIPSSVNYIGDYAFYGCNGIDGFLVDPLNSTFGSVDGLLTNHTQDSIFICPYSKNGKYTIPASVKVIDYQAFDGCINLTEIIFPAGVITIGEYAFEYCTGLKKIDLPRTLTKVSTGAFYNCSALNEIAMRNPIPPSIDYYTFYAVNFSGCYLYVPRGFGSYYRSTPYWSSFYNIIESDFSAISSIVNQEIYLNYHKGVLNITGINHNDKIEIYSITGIMNTMLYANSDNLTIDLPTNSFYILKINNIIYKIST